MSASVVAPVAGEDRFVRFLWISAVVHCVVAVTAVAVAKYPRAEPERPPLVFELVGAPPRGVPGPPAAPAPAEEEAPVDEVAPPPEEAPQSVPAPSPVAPPTKAPVSDARAAKPSAAPSSKLPAGPAAGDPTGDTLSVGGQGGQPSVMNLWLSRVKFQVERNWNAPEGLSGVTAAPEIVFDVARDGQPSRPKLRVKSGNSVLDALALRTIAVAGRFPPVPSTWQGEVVTVRYVLEYAH